MKNSMVARQPILNREKETVAYELLFRTSNKENKFDGSQATAEVISSSLDLIGLDNLSLPIRWVMIISRDISLQSRILFAPAKFHLINLIIYR